MKAILHKNNHLITMPRAVLFLAVLLAPLYTMAAGNDRRPPGMAEVPSAKPSPRGQTQERSFGLQPVHLRADRIDIDQKTGVGLYRGHVLFTQGTLKLTAARATVRSRGSELETVTAEGTPVTFRHRPEGLEEFIEGDAGRAVYHAPTRRVELYKNVNVRRGRDTFRSAVLHYSIENRSITAESTTEQRVYVALVPRARATAKDGGSAGNAGAVFRPTAKDGGSAEREAVPTGTNAGAVFPPPTIPGDRR